MFGTGSITSHDTFLGIDPEEASPDTARVLIQPVPFEQTSTYGHGSKGGPSAIINASRELELFDTELGCETHQEVGGIATLAPLVVMGLEGEGLASQLKAEAARWLDREKFLVTIGGEHTSVVGAIQAHCEHFEHLTVLQLDAHSDLRPEYLGRTWNHACAMARVLDFHSDLVTAGIRSQTRQERDLAAERGIPTIYAHQIHANGNGPDDWVSRIIKATKPNVYITFDCDVMDPSVMPATGTPEPGGLNWLQINTLWERLCRERNVVGLDISEFSPIAGRVDPEFTMAKLIYRFIGHRFNEGSS